MTYQEGLWLIFADEFSAGLVLLNSSPIIMYAAKIFGNYPNISLLLVAVSARISAGLINYWLGRVLYSAFLKYSASKETIKRYEKFSDKFRRYWVVILLCATVPVLGNFVVLLAGLVRYNLPRSMVFAALGTLIYI